MVKGNSFKIIAINATSKSRRTLDLARHCQEVLSSKGIQVLFTSNFKKFSNKSTLKVASDKNIIKNADLLLSIGGDGTMLSSARNFGSQGLPILGVNLGKLGFLSDIPPEEISQGLSDILSGRFKEDDRIFLKASINEDRDIKIALNEIVIHSGTIAQLIEYELFIDQKYVYRQKADGIIFATPTGSTAYSLSGGGPIVHPFVRSVIITPMFPHSLSSGTLIIEENSSIEVKILASKGKVKLSLDSHNTYSLNKGDTIKISKNPSTFKLIHPTNHDFYEGYRNKLGWSTSLVSK